MGLPFKLECWLRHWYRNGPRFRYWSGILGRTAHYDAGQLKAFQDAHFHRLVRHCYENVPYYHDLFQELSLAPEDFQTFGDLEKLPFLDKPTVKANFDKLIAKKHMNRLCNTARTSGSTGTPGQFVRDYDAINFENASVWRHWQQAGDNGARRITIRGDIIVPAAQNHPPFWKYNPAQKELLMSGYHLSPANGKHYISRILEFQPEILYCYPSTGLLLAKFFKDAGIHYKFKAVFTSSESLEPDIRDFIEQTFQSRVYDWYGQAERVAAVAQCTHGTYHILEDYSLVETIPTEFGHELVGTHLHNFVMPLLRYKTGDYVNMENAGPCACGSPFRTVDSIQGRQQSYLLTPEGYRVSVTNHVPRGVENLIETQFYQEKPDEVIVNIVTNGRFSEADRSLLVKNTIEHTSPHMKVVVREVDSIPRGPNGKFLSIVNKLESSRQLEGSVN